MYGLRELSSERGGRRHVERRHFDVNRQRQQERTFTTVINSDIGQGSHEKNTRDSRLKFANSAADRNFDYCGIAVVVELFIWRKSHWTGLLLLLLLCLSRKTFGMSDEY
jgi:hypothetical protein